MKVSYFLKKKWIPLFYGVGILLLLIIFVSPSLEIELQSLPGYFIVEVDESKASFVSEKFSHDSIQNFNPYNQTLSFNNYGVIEEILIAEIPNRFDRRDVRFDPYMDSLLNFFYSPSNQIRFFLKADSCAVIKFFQIFSAIDSFEGWRFLGFSFIKIFFNFILLIFFAIFLYRKCSNLRWLLIPFVALGIVLLLYGSFYLYLFTFLVWAGIFLFFTVELSSIQKRIRLKQDISSSILRKYIELSLILFLPSLLILSFLNFSFLSTVMIFVIAFYSILFVFLFYRKIYLKEMGYGYSGCLVEPIVKNRIAEKRRSILILIVTSTLIFFPTNLIWQIFSMDSTIQIGEKLKIERGTETLALKSEFPNSYLMFAHKSYQKNFVYGIQWIDILENFQNQDYSFSFYNEYLLENEKVSLSKNQSVLYLTDVEQKKVLSEKSFYELLGLKNWCFIYEDNGKFVGKILLKYYLIFFFIVIITAVLFYLRLNPFIIKRRKKKYSVAKEWVADV